MNQMKGVLRSLLFLAACPLALIVTTSFVKTTSFANTIKVGAITCAVTYGLTVLFLRWDGWKLSDVGLARSPRTVPRLFFGIMVGSALVAFQESVLFASGHVHWSQLGAVLPTKSLLPAFIAYLLLALREEIAFRAYPLRRLEFELGLWTSLVILGIVFTLEHLAGGMSWSQSLLGPFIGAILFGMAALATRGIAVPLGIHFAFNFGQWLMGQKETAGFWQAVIDPAFQKQAEALGYTGYLLGTLAATVCFWLYYRKHVYTPIAYTDRNG
ncbi:CPBP family intramembrane glutamic endopeptidase [Silvibacterium acidisoli]|uniref:CPBP family intramembrane glutamic endopeptidase n=1 Tax=Acidobacteriaceae bacterium ZG23-2 TaxID=2883246 RepID=UPI00406CFF6F